jgi:hypothetical protein
MEVNDLYVVGVALYLTGFALVTHGTVKSLKYWYRKRSER